MHVKKTEEVADPRKSLREMEEKICAPNVMYSAIQKQRGGKSTY